MKAKVSLKMFVLSAALLVVSLATSARSYDNQLIYNPIEENGMTVGQTVYKMDGNTLANYMKYNYKYDDNKRMIESEALKWNSSITKACRKRYLSHLVNRLQRLTTGITIRRSNHHLDRSVHIETTDDIRAVHLLHRNELGNRSHIVTTLYLDVFQRFHILTQIRIRLHHYTVHLTEAVKVRGIQTAIISLQGRQDISWTNTGFLTGGSVDIDLILREVRDGP